MGRIIMVIGLTGSFVVWFLYRLLIKRDAANHKHEMGMGLFFIGIWFLLYYFLFT